MNRGSVNDGDRDTLYSESDLGHDPRFGLDGDDERTIETIRHAQQIELKGLELLLGLLQEAHLEQEEKQVGFKAELGKWREDYVQFFECEWWEQTEDKYKEGSLDTEAKYNIYIELQTVRTSVTRRDIHLIAVATPLCSFLYPVAEPSL